MLKCSDFRGIALNTVFSKLFEHCILDIYSPWFVSRDNQFGFKASTGCNHAVYTANLFISQMINAGSTANVLGLDIAKAFPRVNHHALFLKLMARNCPISFLNLLENWLSRATSCVKWLGVLSNGFTSRTGVSQGSVLAPALFAVIIDDVIVRAKMPGSCLILVYADDILLIARSVIALQEVFDVVQDELGIINLELNVDKCAFMRIGPRFDNVCAKIVASNGSCIPRVKEIRYLGIYIIAARAFRCSIDHHRRAFNRAANSILAKVFNAVSLDVLLYLVKTKCEPILLYGLEACSLVRRSLDLLDFTMIRIGFKIFRLANRHDIISRLDNFGIRLPSRSLESRFFRFNVKYMSYTFGSGDRWLL